MSEEFITLTKALKIPLLDEFDTATIQQLQSEWSHWRERERQIMPLRIAEEQKEAFAAFLESPTPEREYQLMLLADVLMSGANDLTAEAGK